MLSKHSANFVLQNKNSLLPVHCAAREKENTKALSFLIEHTNTQLLQQKQKQTNSLEIACGRAKHTVPMILLITKNFSTFKWILQHDFNVNIRDEKGDNLLSQVCKLERGSSAALTLMDRMTLDQI